MQAEKKDQDGIWKADAASIDSSSFDLGSYIAVTSKIQEFFETNKYIVAAPKGYGKTLLLKYRRATNTERWEDEDPITIPTNIEIDSLDNSMPFDHNFIEYLSSQSQWENLWQIAIGYSILANYAIRQNDTEFIQEFRDRMDQNNGGLDCLLAILDKIIKRLSAKQPMPSILRTQLNPSGVISLLLACSLSDLRSAAPQTLDVIHQGCLSIDCKVFVYLDQVDQGVKDFPLALWKNAQNGLVGAIFKLHNPNKHLRIYSSIRAEAWESCKSELYSQYKDYVCELNYDDDDLKEIFEHAIRTYERARPNKSAELFKENPIHEFLGLEQVNNTWGNEIERVFDYILRHSIRRPRDLILLGGGAHTLYRNGKLNESALCELVNRIPGEEIGSQYIIETLRFSESLGNVNLHKFFSFIHKNIFAIDEMVEICSRYNTDVVCGARAWPSSHLEACGRCHAANHMFCDLYRIGLLGIVRKDEIHSDNKRYISFKTPGHIGAEHLPSSQFYALHPAMDHYIKETHSNNLFSPVKGIIVGHGREWHSNYDALLLLARIDQLFRTCGMSFSQNVLDEHSLIVSRLMVKSPSDAEVSNAPVAEVSKLKRMITSDGVISGTKFVADIVGILEKLQHVIGQ